jgi:hypothetical protein
VTHSKVRSLSKSSPSTNHSHRGFTSRHCPLGQRERWKRSRAQPSNLPSLLQAVAFCFPRQISPLLAQLTSILQAYHPFTSTTPIPSSSDSTTCTSRNRAPVCFGTNLQRRPGLKSCLLQGLPCSLPTPQPYTRTRCQAILIFDGKTFPCISNSRNSHRIAYLRILRAVALLESRSTDVESVQRKSHGSALAHHPNTPTTSLVSWHSERNL